VTAVGALRKLPVAPMFEDFDDDVLVEVMLVDSVIDDRSSKALVMFIPHGDPREFGQAPLPPALVPASWFGGLMPVSIFLDIPTDAAALAPSWESDVDGVAHTDEIKAGLGEELAARWRANKRPIATTKAYVARCFRLAPPNLLSIGLDAVEALETGRFSKAARSRIATFCELMSRHLDSLQAGSEKPE